MCEGSAGPGQGHQLDQPPAAAPAESAPKAAPARQVALQQAALHAALARAGDVRPPAEPVVLPARANARQILAATADAFREMYHMFEGLQVGQPPTAWLLPCAVLQELIMNFSTL